jgi:hypothetical protein
MQTDVTMDGILYSQLMQSEFDWKLVAFRRAVDIQLDQRVVINESVGGTYQGLTLAGSDMNVYW